MYPSGEWDGFWVSEWLGRRPMASFRLQFRDGEVTGSGVDVVGRFVIAGSYDRKDGAVTFVKQYLGQHKVVYRGRPDGEGSIGGEWAITEVYGGVSHTTRGPFLLRPKLPDQGADLPIRELFLIKYNK
jgi:hypothetical protein